MLRAAALAAAGLGLGFAAGPAMANGAKTLYVGSGGTNSSGGVPNTCLTESSPCATISYAVTEASPGDTISLAAGVINENVTLSKRVTIQGKGPDQTTVQAVTRTSPVFLMNVPLWNDSTNNFRVEFRDLTIQGANNAGAACTGNVSGIQANTGFNGRMTLDDVALSGNCNGLVFNGSTPVSDVDIIDSDFATSAPNGGATNGIRIATAVPLDDLAISGSSFTGSTFGINADRANPPPVLRDIRISRSTFTDHPRSAIFLSAATSLSVVDSIITFAGLTGANSVASADNLFYDTRRQQRRVRGIVAGNSTLTGVVTLSGLSVTGINNLTASSVDSNGKPVDFIGVKIGLDANAGTGTATLRGSTVTDFPVGVEAGFVEGTSNAQLDDLTISNSELGTSAPGTVGLTFPAPTGSGISVGTPTVTSNSIRGPLTWALGRTLNAPGTWWGQETGPANGQITGTVDSAPWIVSYANDPARAGQPGFWPINIVYSSPNAQIASGPSGRTEATTATFTFSAEGADRYECSLDGAAFVPCTSPATYTGVAVGDHEFRVRPVDADGRMGATVSRSWTVVAPVTTQPGSLVEQVGPTVFEIPGGNVRPVSGGGTPGLEVNPTDFTNLGYIPVGSVTCVPTTDGFCTVVTQTDFLAGGQSSSERAGEMQAGRTLSLPASTSRLGPGQSTPVRADLTSQARAFLRPDRPVQMRITVTATDPAGVSTTKVTTLNLDLPRPEFAVRATSRQRVAQRGAVTLQVRCTGADCRVNPRMGFAVTLPKGVKASPSGRPPRGALQPLAFTRRSITANRWTTVRLDLGRYRAGVIGRQLDRPRNVAMPITVTAGNSTGLQSTVRLTVRARR